MRISTSVISNMATSSMSNAYKAYADILSKIASGKNFTKMSENPIDASKVLKLNDQLAQMNEYQSNIQTALNEMNLAFDTLDNVTGKLSEINSLVIKASDGTTSPESAKAIANDIKAKVDSIKDMMNTKYMNNYIFSGTYIKEAPYKTAEDGTVQYQGSSKESGDRNLTISEGTTFTYNITGEEIFGKEDDGSYFFKEMEELDKLLREDTLDHDAIREKLGSIDAATSNITQMQGVLSSKVSKLDSTYNINDDTIISLTEKKADLEEVDLITAAGQLASAQQALQASYLVGTNVLGSVSLLDYL